MDGTLLGLIAAVAVLAGLTLHWQHRWTVAFHLLEATRTQAHRLTESTAVMEQHLLHRSQQPNRLVPTQVADLVHLDPPDLEQRARQLQTQRTQPLGQRRPIVDRTGRLVAMDEKRFRLWAHPRYFNMPGDAPNLVRPAEDVAEVLADPWLVPCLRC